MCKTSTPIFSRALLFMKVTAELEPTQEGHCPIARAHVDRWAWTLICAEMDNFGSSKKLRGLFWNMGGKKHPTWRNHNIIFCSLFSIFWRGSHFDIIIWFVFCFLRPGTEAALGTHKIMSNESWLVYGKCFRNTFDVVSHVLCQLLNKSNYGPPTVSIWCSNDA